MRSLLMIVAGMCVTVVFALDYPVYTVTTSGDGTSDLTSAQVEVVSTEGANPEMVGFSSLSLTTGTFRKRGTGYLMSADAMSGFKGTILVEEGAFIAQKNGHLGPAQSGTAGHGDDHRLEPLPELLGSGDADHSRERDEDQGSRRE